MRTVWMPLAVGLTLAAAVFFAGFYTAERIARTQPQPIVVERLPLHENNSTPKTESTQGQGGVTDGGVVASVNSEKFHYPWCPGAKQIKEKNKIVFESAAEAISAGFTLAGNCN